MSPRRQAAPISRPPPVGPGDVVGVAALSSAPPAGELAAGVHRLVELGFRVLPASNLGAHWQGFAGTDEERLRGFHELVAAPEVKAIIFARGGHGLLRVLPGIDWELLAARPKAYVGYSDVVPLLLQIVERLHLVAFHGPMVATELARPLDGAERDSLLDALAGRYGRTLRCEGLAGGAPVEGRLLGGCLAMLVATLGTPWFPRLERSLLFLEDTHEPMYRLDRMLTQLELSGRVRGVKGMILGHLGEPTGAASAARGGAGGSARSALPAARELIERRIAGEARRIMAWNLACGHGRPNLTLPLGLPARLDPAAGTLTVLDDGSAGD